MSASATRPRYDFREYVRLEEFANLRHEFLRGEIYAMAGGSPEHAAIAVNVSSALSAQLHGRGCRAHSSDLRVRIRATGLTTYPDVTVVCGRLETDPEDEHTIMNPTVVVEVTSPTSEAYDRGEKLDHYKQMPSLREVVIVSHAAPRIDVWHRRPDGTWAVSIATAGEQAALPATGCVLVVDAVYHDELTGQSLV